MVHGRVKSKSTKEVFHDTRRVALSKHITHYGPREGKIKIYKEVFYDAKRVALSKHITHYGPREGKIKIYKRGIL
jgi:hypothetical protein